MNDNPEGTPNPLNPAMDAGNGAEAAGTGALDFVETELTAEPVGETTPTKVTIEETKAEEAVEPASFAQPAATGPAPISSAMPEMAKPAPTSAMPEIKTASASTKFNGPVVDPMMRPRENNNFDTLDVRKDPEGEIPFDEITEDIVTSSITTKTPTDFVAKDSIVESSTNKKKPLIIGAIILIMIAVICGAAAIAIFAFNSNGGDRVPKAIVKLLNGETSNIINVKGTITMDSNVDDVSDGSSIITSYIIDFDGTFDAVSSVNKVSADINGEFISGKEATISVNELRDEAGDIFFKINGLKTLISDRPIVTIDNSTDCVGMEGMDSCVTTTTTTNTTTNTATNCVDGDPYTNCGPSEETTQTISTLDILSLYSGLFEAVDNQWILVSGDFSEEMEGLNIFGNSSACIVNAMSTLPEYSKNLASTYNANQFITYSTNNLGISKKKDELYRIGFDADKLASFINALSTKGFMNELNACTGNVATNSTVTSEMVEKVLANFPAVYVEIDNNNNFTRVYFKANTTMNDAATTVVADLAISYPAKVEITAPESYVDMSTLLNNAMVNLLDQ